MGIGVGKWGNGEMGKWGNGEGPNVPNEDDATGSTVTNNEPSDSVISVCFLAEIDHESTALHPRFCRPKQTKQRNFW